MTKPPYPRGWPAGSQVTGLAVAAGYARYVNLNNGNSNWNHQDNHNQALAVRASECEPVSFAALLKAYRAARAGKKPSAEQLTFEVNRLDELLDLQDDLNAHTWHPGAPTCFVVTDPKHRQIHAPPFADRVVHHLVVPMLERIFDRGLIHDSYSNRRGKGTHAAVRRLQQFVRQVDSGQGGGWYLQLDIANFFNSIHRPTLWWLMKPRMERAGLPEWARRATHALLNWPIERTGVHWACTPAQREALPLHKRLENAPRGRGIAIGNLSSQFFANVYLDRLDHHVKHVLKVPRYLRYVDDFVLVHKDRAQLQEWLLRIQGFLQVELMLELKAEPRLRPLRDGIDFLGYVVRPTHIVVRKRVVDHCIGRLEQFQRRANFSHSSLKQLRIVWASYSGHFLHARCWRLCRRLHARFTWLAHALTPKDSR